MQSNEATAEVMEVLIRASAQHLLDTSRDVGRPVVVMEVKARTPLHQPGIVIALEARRHTLDEILELLRERFPNADIMTVSEAQLELEVITPGSERMEA